MILPNSSHGFTEYYNVKVEGQQQGPPFGSGEPKEKTISCINKT